jgi:hypothetical protein
LPRSVTRGALAADHRRLLIRGHGFVEDHHLGYECLDVKPVREPALLCNRGEVLVHIAAIIRLVIVLRKAFEQPIIDRLVAALERVEQDQPSARLQHTRALLNDDAAYLWRQFVDHEDARDRVDTVIRHRDGFRIGDEKIDARPPSEMTPRMSDIARALFSAPEDREHFFRRRRAQ